MISWTIYLDWLTKMDGKIRDSLRRYPKKIVELISYIDNLFKIQYKKRKIINTVKNIYNLNTKTNITADLSVEYW